MASPTETRSFLSPRCEARLGECRPELRDIVRAVAARFPLLVLCGHRDRAAQEKAFAEGKTKLHWPYGKHNKMPSWAVDIAPAPYNDKDIAAYARMAKEVMAEAARQGVKLRHGADWNQNGRTDDERFLDWAHFELVEA